MEWCSLLVVLGAVCLMTRPLLVNGGQGVSEEDDISRCRDPPNIDNGDFINSHGTLVRYHCDAQHTIYGDNSRQCQRNGKWSGTAPVCSAPGCSETDSPHVQNALVSQYNGGTVRVYRCYAGFEPQGQGTPMAYCDGTRWRNQPPQCVRQRAAAAQAICATPPSVANARMTRGPDGLVTYTCASSYQRYGDKAIRCGADGQWIGSPAVCIRAGCSIPGAYQIDHGVITTKRGGAILKIYCLSGYDHRGSSVLLCNGQNWNGSLPTCVAKQENNGYPTSILQGDRCGHPPTVQHSSLTYESRHDADRNLFYAVRYYCLSGYILNPANYAVYCSAGNVVGTPPHCMSTCGNNNGGCRQICTNSPKGAVCSCRDGYRLTSDGKICQDFNECKANNGRGPCQHSCYNFDGGFSCYCQSGFSLSSDKASCLANQGQCNCGPNGRCISQFGTGHMCHCNEGYRASNDGLRCLKRQCDCGTGSTSCTEVKDVKTCTCDNGYRASPDASRCIDIDECQESVDGLADCQAGCLNTVGSYRCYCPGVWRRLADDLRSCQETPCSCGQGSVSCSQPNGQKICTCAEGYTLNGVRCIDRNECQEPSPCHGGCINTLGSYRCRCMQSGYQLAADRHSCEDIDECQNPGSHNCKHACVNVPGGYRCDCPPGHFLMPDGITCQGCRPNSYRIADTANVCIECPVHSRTVGRAKTSIEDCHCLPGYNGDYSRDIPCKDDDECKQDNGGCKQHCINTPGSFYCACPNGFNLMEDGKTCADHDECRQSNGGCQHVCFNTEGSFYCSCNEGYVADPTDPYLCVDVDECATDSHDCQQMCVNFPGSFHCQCDHNSILALDGKTCNPVICSPLVLPEKMKMSPRDLCLGNHEINQITVGTTCRLSCQRGYELQGANNRTCMNTGHWSAQLSTCTPVRCPALSHPDNGQVRPQSCLLANENEFKGSCVYYCNEGYTMVGSSFTNCQASGEWSNEVPVCKEVTEITCPRDLSVVLAIGASHAVVDLPKPVHTLDRLESSVPSTGHAFPEGRTTVTYTAWSNSSDSTAACSFDVIVTDEESPVFEFCPESFTVKTEHQYPQIDWQEPVVTDNVGVVENTTWISPDGRFTWGTYTVLIDAYDAAENSASCKFSISIQTVECGTPNGPLNGDSDCSDWMFGKICDPRCNQSHYFFDGPQESVYLCGFNGLWTPSSEVPDCSPYKFLGNQTTCPFGSELKSFAALGAPVCITCPRGMYSTLVNSTSTCLPCAVGTYQDGFGQEYCKSCSDGETTLAEAAKSITQCFENEDVPMTGAVTTEATTTQPGLGQLVLAGDLS